MIIPLWVLAVVAVVILCIILRLTIFKATPSSSGMGADLSGCFVLVIGVVGILSVLAIKGFVGW
jgi:hypothetical protein